MLKRVVRRAYVRWVPESVRSSLRALPWIARLRESLVQSDTRLHDEFYDAAFYQSDARDAARSAKSICRYITEHLRPTSFIDIGCGTGEYLICMRDSGAEVHGVELARHAIAHCESAGLDVVCRDLTVPGSLPWKADVVMCAEVAEHLPERSARTLVQTVTASAKIFVVFTAAPPGQPGLNHINCQDAEYWIEKFAECHFDYQNALTQQWRSKNQEEGLQLWWYSNLLVFRRAESRP